jgi:hypothetical protein
MKRWRVYRLRDGIEAERRYWSEAEAYQAKFALERHWRAIFVVEELQ